MIPGLAEKLIDEAVRIEAQLCQNDADIAEATDEMKELKKKREVLYAELRETVKREQEPTLADLPKD
jgi:hypothetical protein